MNTTRTSLLTLAVCGLGSLAPLAFAQEPSFSDIPANHVVYPAVEYLKQQGIISGYSDGTFRPHLKVNRAEALKIIVAPLVKQEALAALTSTPYEDIPSTAWYIPYVEAARTDLGIIDSPPKKTVFKGSDPIRKAEFLKMLLLAYKVDPYAYGEIKLPLANDVTNSEEWFYPFMRYSIASSMSMVQEGGVLTPAKELTRGDVSLLLYRFLMYKQSRRTQALLSEAEGEIVTVLDAIGKNEVVQAEYASARALLASRGALTSRPDSNVVKGALKITESFRALVRAYRAGLNLDFATVLQLTGDAYRLADTAVTLSPELSSIAGQVKSEAKSMADSARSIQAQNPQIPKQ